MSVTAIGDYRFAPRDAQANFHGNIVVYLHWEGHNSFCAALAFPLPPDMPFGAILSDLLPTCYGSHPDWAKIDWNAATWTLDGAPFTPDPARAIGAQGIGHKSLLRFWTPGLDGVGGSRS